MHQISSSNSAIPVGVLLATHNGMAWLPEQVASILGQDGVDIVLWVSDDCSTDGSRAWLESLASQDPRIRLLPARERFGSAARNFYHLLQEADLTAADFVAFADQDDVWHLDKLISAIDMLRRHDACAVSSNVTAFWPDGRRALVHKAQPQVAYDYLSEAAGPGCTYVMTPTLVEAVRRTLPKMHMPPALHDWFCYAVCRAHGWHWVINPVPSMEYRQHGKNEVGVNQGMSAAKSRYSKVASGWYLNEVLALCRLAVSLRPMDQSLARLVTRLQRGNGWDRLVLAFSTPRLRRRWRDRLVLSAYFLTGLFWGRRG